MTRSILVIDDELAFCAVVGEILELFGFEVHTANTVRAALKVLDQITPDLILTDIMMPDSDGLSFIRRLRSSPHWSSVPIIVVSAKTIQGDLDAAREAGANAWLPKPFTSQDLRDTLEKYLVS